MLGHKIFLLFRKECLIRRLHSRHASFIQRRNNGVCPLGIVSGLTKTKGVIRCSYSLSRVILIAQNLTTHLTLGVKSLKLGTLKIITVIVKNGRIQFYAEVLGLKDGDGFAKSVDPDQIASDLGLHCLFQYLENLRYFCHPKF